MGHNRRYEAQYDALNDGRIAAAAAAPITLPVQAYGLQPIEWVPHGNGPEVSVWVSWANRPATRIRATAAGWNDRVVIVEWGSAWWTPFCGGLAQCCYPWIETPTSVNTADRTTQQIHSQQTCEAPVLSGHRRHLASP